MSDYQDIKSKILNMVLDRENVSFAELSRDIPGFKGDREITYESYSNIILWSEISETAINALKALLNDGSLFFRPTKYMTYLIDGTTLNLPLA
jgi:hypothetical protein